MKAGDFLGFTARLGSQVFKRITGQAETGKDHQVGLSGHGLPDIVQVKLQVLFRVAKNG